MTFLRGGQYLGQYLMKSYKFWEKCCKFNKKGWKNSKKVEKKLNPVNPNFLKNDKKKPNPVNPNFLKNDKKKPNPVNPNFAKKVKKITKKAKKW